MGCRALWLLGIVGNCRLFELPRPVWEPGRDVPNNRERRRLAVCSRKGLNMKVTIENGELVIRLPLEKPRPSKSGKTMVVATSGGNRETAAEVDGKRVTVGVNCYIKR